MARMKRAITFVVLVAIVALVYACCSGGCSRVTGFGSAVAGKLSPAIEKVKELLPESSGVEDASSGGDAGAEADEWSLPSLDDISLDSVLPDGASSAGSSLGAGEFSSVEDVALVPVDDWGQSYVFDYAGEQFSAYFDSYSWRVYDSYKITNHGDIVKICQALLDEHPVYGSDWVSYRTADDMTFEWEQHNLAYSMLPADSHWRDDAKDVDLDPDDQGKTFPEIYESRTGQKFDIRNYL